MIGEATHICQNKQGRVIYFKVVGLLVYEYSDISNEWLHSEYDRDQIVCTARYIK